MGSEMCTRDRYIMEEIAAYIKYFNGKRPAYDKLIKIPASALVRLRVIGDITL